MHLICQSFTALNRTIVHPYIQSVTVAIIGIHSNQLEFLMTSATDLYEEENITFQAYRKGV